MPDIFDQLASQPQQQASPSQQGSNPAGKGDIFDQIASQQKPQQPQQDAIQQGLNYHPSNPFLNAGLGVVQGIGKGVMSSGLGALNVISKVSGQPQYVTPQYQQSVTEPSGPGQGTGKFLEQAGEFAGASAFGGAATEGTGLAFRAATQAGAGALVSGIQSGGDPLAIATGGVLGGAGEVAGPVIKVVGKYTKHMAPNVENFSNAFRATPSQKIIINKALPTLVRDGKIPTDSVLDSQAMVKDHLDHLRTAYQSLPQDISTRIVHSGDVIKELQGVQKGLERNGVVISANKSAWDTVQNQIEDVQNLSAKNNGNISFDDLKHLRDGANGKTNFASPEADQNLYRSIGGSYRKLMDKIAPETTQLNHDYAQYKTLEKLADHNIAMGRGTTKSGLDRLADRAVSSGAGATAGEVLGHAVAGPVGGAVGAGLGSYLGPALSKPVVQALKNAADNGMLSNMAPAVQNVLSGLVKAGNNAGVKQFLSGMSKEEITKHTRLGNI